MASGRRATAKTAGVEQPTSGDQDLVVGCRIKELRKAKGLTMTQLATLANLSSGGLSQIESGTILPSLTTLRRIAAALDEPIFRFFVDHNLEPEVVVRADARPKVTVPWSGVAYELLTPSLHGDLEVIEMRLEPGEVSAESELGHGGEECMVVLRGRVRLELGEAAFDLNVGDSATYQGTVPHRILNIGDETAIALSAITPPSF